MATYAITRSGRLRWQVLFKLTGVHFLELWKSSDALLLGCSDAEVGQDRASGIDLTEYFEHLKRDCKELLEKEPQNAEYQKFVPAFVSLLREAMQLRGRGLEDGDYYDEAKRIKNEMLKMINAQAKDPGLQKYQDIFRRHPERIFQWVENRSVPAENNMSERGVRRTVIARKVCGGSQSKDALMVCEVLQSVIESLRLRCADPVAKLTEALDAYAMDPGICIPDLLFPLPTHKAELSRRRAGTRRV